MAKQFVISFTLLITLSCPSYADYDRASAIRLNNGGVTALGQGNYFLAIRMLEESLKVDPTYEKAKQNLAIAYNNQGLTLQRTPKEAIKCFHKALALDTTNETTKLNLDGIIGSLGRNPKSFTDRIYLAEQAQKDSDFAGAIIEYEAALAIQDDKYVREEMEKLKKDHPSPYVAK